MTGKAKAAGCPLDPDNLYEFFINEVRKNLHVALCFSPVGDAFRNRCLKFPALANSTVIDWFQPWPKEALYSVGKKFVANIEFGEGAKADGCRRGTTTSTHQNWWVGRSIEFGNRRQSSL